MREINQNEIEYFADQVRIGKMTADEANVEMVRCQRVLVVTKLPLEVRRALNNAVKNNRLGHWEKTEKYPEVYFHPSFDYMAKKERAHHYLNKLKALAAVHVKKSDIKNMEEVIYILE